jgi:hypothetical protein
MLRKTQLSEISPKVHGVSLRPPRDRIRYPPTIISLYIPPLTCCYESRENGSACCSGGARCEWIVSRLVPDFPGFIEIRD